MPSDSVETALTQLRPLLNRVAQQEAYRRTVRAKQEVVARFQPTFAPPGVARLTERDMREFLLFENNRHWYGLQRLGPRICADMDKLRSALGILVDESKPIKSRLDRLVPKSGPIVTKLNRAVLTAILQVTYPDKYGVWNNVSMGGLKELGTWPNFDRADSFGARYLAVNAVLSKLASGLGIDLWSLDSLWWQLKGQDVDGEDDESPTVEEQGEETEESHRFGLESYLQEFLRDNWDQIGDLGREWALLEEDGEITGYEYQTDIGRIDLLAHHRQEPRWLVIELKRNQASDKTVGQVLRYIGWVSKHLTKDGESVEGLIIARVEDPSLRYALMPTRGVRVRLYDVKFQLRD